MEYRYNINQFTWKKDENTFYGYIGELVTDDGLYSVFDKNQFVIFNEKTGGFRRFRFLKEDELDYGKEYVFSSEDGITARILWEVVFEPDFDINLEANDIE